MTHKALSATLLAEWLGAFAADIEENEDLLTDLDRKIGDADHGLNMSRGMTAVAALDASEFSDAKAYLKKAAMTLISTVGGASGPLYGTLLLRMSMALPDDGPITTEQWAEALRAGVKGVQDRGKAEAGEKTMLDALLPAVEAFSTADEPWQAAATAAAEGRDATVDMVAHKGRASYLGERSVGTADPGATSSTLLLQAAARTLV